MSPAPLQIINTHDDDDDDDVQFYHDLMSRLDVSCIILVEHKKKVLIKPSWNRK